MARNHQGPFERPLCTLTLSLLAAGVLVWSFGDLAQWPVSAAYVARIAPPGLVGRYAGARSLVYGLAATVAPTLGMALYGLNATAVWPACLGLALVAGALFARPVASPARRPVDTRLRLGGG